MTTWQVGRMGLTQTSLSQWNRNNSLFHKRKQYFRQ